MSRARCFASILLMVFALQPAGVMAQESQELAWHDGNTLAVEGRGWDDAAGPFVRLPDAAKDKVIPTAWQQSRDSAGISIRFVTDAATVSVRWSLRSSTLAMGHMPSTGVSGVDLYARNDDDEWRFVGNGRPSEQDGNLAEFHFPGDGKPGRECLLYLPLYNGTKSLEIGVPRGAVLEKPTPRPEGQRKPVVVYGTSIAQGGCASRPGMAWPAILGRMLDRPVINLGFSGSGNMEAPVGDVLAELDPSVFVIDCIWNMGVGEDVFHERVTQLVKAIRKEHPHTPILFVGQSMIRPDAHPTDRSTWQADAVRNLQEKGVEGLTVVPGRDLIGDDGEATVDGVHLTDLGMQRQANALLPVVRKALGKAD